jgi:transcription antitermination factor NusG
MPLMEFSVINPDIVNRMNSSAECNSYANPATECRPWFAIQVRSMQERLVNSHLNQRGYVTFVPFRTKCKQWSDRSKKQQVALFPGYLFCKLDPANRLPVLMAPGVIQIVGNGKVPVAVAPEEIRAIQTIIESNVEVERWPYIEVGEWVRVAEGPFEGFEGSVVQVRNRYHLVISVAVLQQSIAIVIDRSDVERTVVIRPYSQSTNGALRLPARERD